MTTPYSARRMHTVLVVFVYVTLGYAVGTNMLVPLLPRVQQEYGLDEVQAVWVTISTLLTGALFIPSLCRLADIRGWRKQILLVSVACVAVGGAVAALSDNLPTLLLGRGLQGVGAAATPMTSAIVNENFTPALRRIGLPVKAASLFAGAGAGGIMAALLVDEPSGFRILFWTSAAIPALGFLLIASLVPATPTLPDSRIRAVDLPGAIGFVVPVAALVVGFSYASRWGWTSPAFLGLMVVGVLVFPVWVAVERRTRDPLVDLKVFFSRPITIANISSVFVGFAIFGSMVSTSTYIQLPPVPGLGGLGKSGLAAALLILPAELLMLGFGPVVGRLSARWGKGLFLVAGPAVQAVGYLVLIARHGSLAAVVTAIVVIGVGTGLIGPVWALTYVEDIPPEHVGRVYGIAPILSQGVGGSLAGALFGAILVANRLPGGKLPSEGAFIGFWWLAAGCALVAGLCGAAYLKSYGTGGPRTRREAPGAELQRGAPTAV
ncbi:MFS transporter [Streptomyces spiralis]|uniref:MFS transporter n=1 Tax=Streptomyces spiralis TaxID=66376 RepID=A0A919AK22_9ACTN|nr:MFS transporter [Streptomyces spiralis]GHF11480.1 MFS transporter [Streptomyces spiralis]